MKLLFPVSFLLWTICSNAATFADSGLGSLEGKLGCTNLSRVAGPCEILNRLTSNTIIAPRSTQSYCIGTSWEIYNQSLSTKKKFFDVIRVKLNGNKVTVHWQPLKGSDAGEAREIENLVAAAKKGKKMSFSKSLEDFLARKASERTTESAVVDNIFKMKSADLSADAAFTKDGIQFLHSWKGSTAGNYMLIGFAWCP